MLHCRQHRHAGLHALAGRRTLTIRAAKASVGKDSGRPTEGRGGGRGPGQERTGRGRGGGSGRGEAQQQQRQGRSPPPIKRPPKAAQGAVIAADNDEDFVVIGR